MLKLVKLSTFFVLAGSVVANNKFLEDCTKSLYGCCSDERTEALGPEMEGCGVALCIDIKSSSFCRAERRRGSCKKGRYGDTDYDTASRMTRDCARTCRRCKHATQKACVSSVYGCCWDNSFAKGPDNRPGKDCPRCRDFYRSYCRRNRYQCSEAQGPRTRSFLRNSCQMSCRICSYSASVFDVLVRDFIHENTKQ